jgi:hypothetical protein
MLIILTFSCIVSCKKSNNSGVTLSDKEKKLLGKWSLQKQIIEQAGQPTIENDSFLPICYMAFEDYPAPLENKNSPIYSNTKTVEDNKDCSWLLNAWKIDNNDKLLLASLDTLYADILFLSTDSLALKVPFDNHVIITYTLSK